MSIDFYLDRAQQSALRDSLATIPALVEELAITITRQARIQRTGPSVRRLRPESRLPFHLGAVNAADELHNALVTWVRLLCEERHIHYHGHDDDISLARWLRKHVTQLALCEGSEEAGQDIADRVEQCRQWIDLPPEDEIVIHPDRVKAANRSVLTLSTVDAIAVRLGDMGKGLNRDRLRLLAKRGDVRPTSTDPDTGTNFYQLGDVLHAHHDRNKRSRKRA